MRNIKTNYFAQAEGSNKRIQIKTNKAANPESAVLRAVHHLRRDSYKGALLAEIYDETDGTLHAILKAPINQDTVTILYKRPLAE